MKSFERIFLESIDVQQWLSDWNKDLTEDQKKTIAELEKGGWRKSYVLGPFHNAFLFKKDPTTDDWSRIKVCDDGHTMAPMFYGKEEDMEQWLLDVWKREDMQKRFGKETGDIVSDL